MDDNGGEAMDEASTEWAMAGGLVTGALSSEAAPQEGGWAEALPEEKLERKFQAAWQLFQSVGTQV